MDPEIVRRPRRARGPLRRTAIAIALSVTAATGLLLAGAASAATPGATSWTPSTYADRLAALVNDARVKHGLPKLTVTSGTTTVALNWAQHLAASGTLSHNPNVCAEVAKHGSPDWTVVEENVGDGSVGDPDGLFAAYMNSPEHRSNILDSEVHYLGNGVAFSHGMAWNTMDFVDQYGATTTSSTTTTTTKTARHHRRQATAPAPAPAPAPARAPAPTAVAPPAPAPTHHTVTHAAPVPRSPVHRVTPGVALPHPRARVAPVAGTVPSIPTSFARAASEGAGSRIAHLLLVGVAAGLLLAYAPLSFAVRTR